jgi:hypothetical protein
VGCLEPVDGNLGPPNALTGETGATE